MEPTNQQKIEFLMRLIQPGQRLALLFKSKDGSKKAMGFAELFDRTLEWEAVVRAHVEGRPFTAKIRNVSSRKIFDKYVDRLDLGVYYGGGAENLACSYALDCDLLHVSLASIDTMMEDAQRAFPSAVFFKHPAGKWHAHGTFDALRPSTGIREAVTAMLPESCKSIEVFPKSRHFKMDEWYNGNQIRLPFGSAMSAYTLVGDLHEPPPISADAIPTYATLSIAQKATETVATPMSAEQSGGPNGVERRKAMLSQYMQKMGRAEGGTRHTKTFALAANCQRDHGLDKDTTLEIVMGYNQAMCSPPLPDEEILKQVQDGANYGSHQPLHLDQTDFFGQMMTELKGRQRDTHTPLKAGGVCVSVLPENGGKEKAAVSLPAPIGAAQLAGRTDITIPPDLWEGIVCQGGKLLLVGPPKMKKTWTMTGFAISVCQGRPYWGHETRKCKVLYIDFEMMQGHTRWRSEQVHGALGVPKSDDLMLWNLKGHARAIEELEESIIKVADREYGMIVLDPTYKCLGRRSENDAGDMNDYCNVLDRIAFNTGATVVSACHFPKGNGADKAAQDRIAGSGVPVRDADAVLVMTPLKEEEHVGVEGIVRHHAAMEPFALRWNFPLMQVVDGIDPMNIVGSAATEDIPIVRVLECLPPANCRTSEMRQKKEAVDALRRLLREPKTKCEAAFNRAVMDGLIHTSEIKRPGTNALKVYRQAGPLDKVPSIPETEGITDLVPDGPLDL